MTDATLNYAATIIKVAIWSYLFVQASRLNLLTRYRYVFAYIAVAAFCDLAMLAAAAWLGDTAEVYLWVYLTGELVIWGSGIAVLLWIYFLPDSKPGRGDWHLALAVLGVILLEWATRQPAWLGFRLLSTVSTYQFYVGLAVLFRLAFSSRVLLGRNLWAVVIALLVPASLETFNNLAYLINSNLWGYQPWAWVTKPIVITSWLILAWGMSRDDPPARIQVQATAEEQEETRVLIEQNFRLLRKLGKGGER